MPEVTVAAADIPEASARSLHATVSSLNAHVASPLRMCVCARAHTRAHACTQAHVLGSSSYEDTSQAGPWAPLKGSF